MLKPELLEILACPQCKERLVLDPSGESLLCERCKLRYPIREDIPIMLLEEAVPY
jgi:uncharacterized protein YbaR (Trm112 family)